MWDILVRWRFGPRPRSSPDNKSGKSDASTRSPNNTTKPSAPTSPGAQSPTKSSPSTTPSFASATNKHISSSGIHSLQTIADRASTPPSVSNMRAIQLRPSLFTPSTLPPEQFRPTSSPDTLGANATEDTAEYDDSEERAILKPILRKLEQLKATTKDRMPPDSAKVKVKPYMHLLRERLFPVGQFVVAKTRDRADRWEMEVRLW